MIVYLVFIGLLSEVMAIPIVLRNSSPTGESVVAISSSDPNIEKYLSENFSTRSGFKAEDPIKKNQVYRSFSFAAPGKAVAGTARSIVAASTNPFQSIFPIPIFESYRLNDLYLKNWLRSVENLYYPSFAGNGGVNTVTAINDNGHIYGKVGSVSFDNRSKTNV